RRGRESRRRRLVLRDRDRPRGGPGGAFVVGHPQPDRDFAFVGVGLADRRRRPGARLIGPVAVQVPFVFGDRAVRSAGGGGVEGHVLARFGRGGGLERRGRPVVGAVAVELFGDRRAAERPVVEGDLVEVAFAEQGPGPA